MSVLVFAELDNGSIKKSSLEAIYYGSEVAKAKGSSVTVLAIGESSNEALAIAGKYGATKVLWASDARLNVASIVSNVVDLPDFSSGVTVKRSIYTGKAFATVALTADKKVIAIKKNAVNVVEGDGSASIENFAPALNDADFAVKVTGTHKASGQVSLPEADLVVSAGRGLKGPENWGIVEDLANALGAATACSKPVSDLDWRPHHEHVGQTGIKVSPNLYIACGISGAIQHLAGVNSSKVIVVINKDPEAPFFKAADYGIVGDVFDVLPRLTKAIQAAK